MDATKQAKPPTAANQNDDKTASKPDPQAGPCKTPTDPLLPMLERARRGDTSVLPELKQALENNPSIWRDCYNLVAMAEQAWLDKIAGKDLLASQSLRRHVEQLKVDLIGPMPPPLEKLLADRIAAAWLAVHHAEMAEAFGDASGGKVARMRLARLESAHRRFLSATTALVLARRLINGLKIEIRHSTQEPAGESNASNRATPAHRRGNQPGVAADRHDAVHQRLRTLFDEDAAQARELAAEVGT